MVQIQFDPLPMIKIIQPAGLGDILFCMKIAVEKSSPSHEGETVYWPISECYSYLPHKITPLAMDNIHFEEPPDYPVITPLQLDGQNSSNGVMLAKYEYAEVLPHNWQDYWCLKNNYSAIDKLREILGISSNTEYSFVQDTYGSPPNEVRHHKIMERSPWSGLKQIRMRQIEGFTPFEWAAIAANATELIITDSCLLTILEKYYLWSEIKNRHVFCRSPESKHAVEPLFRHKYNYY